MAYTLFSDIPNFSAAAVRAAGAFLTPEFYNDDILQSPIIVRSARFDELAQAGSSDISVPFLSPLDETIEENTANLDPSVIADIHGITGGNQRAKLNYKDQVFGSSRIASTLRGIDIMPQIAGRVARYKIQRQKVHLTTVVSALAVTSGADFTVDASSDVASYDVIIDGKAMFGDASGKAVAVLMHSTQKTFLEKAQLGFLPPAATNTLFGTIHGLTIIVSDSMPVGLMVVLGAEAFSYGEAQLGEQALEYGKEPRASDGWGADYLVGRWQYILHPQGYEFVGSVTAGKASPTLDDMKNGNDWKLLDGINKKQVPFRFIKVGTTPKTTSTTTGS